MVSKWSNGGDYLEYRHKRFIVAVCNYIKNIPEEVVNSRTMSDRRKAHFRNHTGWYHNLNWALSSYWAILLIVLGVTIDYFVASWLGFTMNFDVFGTNPSCYTTSTWCKTFTRPTPSITSETTKNMYSIRLKSNREQTLLMNDIGTTPNPRIIPSTTIFTETGPQKARFIPFSTEFAGLVVE